jgi:glutamate/tyrosine decarboxylase-like PLP-dependent enzyme
MSARSEFDLAPQEIVEIGRIAAEAIAQSRGELLDRPVFERIGPLAGLFGESVPEDSTPVSDVLGFVARNILPRTTGSAHPRYFGFVNSSVDPVAVVADYLAAAMNSNCWGGDHAANHVEDRVVRWLAEILGLSENAEGILVSGGSMANFTALAAARREMTPGNVREEGVAADGRPRLTVYASDQIHSCVDKAVDLLGLGTGQLRKIPTGGDFRIRMDLLREAVAADRRSGFLPAIVCGSAGTVNTGAVDPLTELAEFCRSESLWFHVDGAYGALASISPRLKPLFAGIELADSVAADPHKWLFVPFEAGAAFTREPGRLKAAFRKFPEYLDTDPKSPLSGPVWFAERGVELSRNFKALKVWMGLKTHGKRAYARIVEENVRLARVLAEEVDRRPNLERLAPVELSIVNFRYRPPRENLSEGALTRLNRLIIHRIVGGGSAFVYPTVLNGRTSIRVCIVNFRTREEDLAILLDDVERFGRELAVREEAGGRSPARATL